MTENHVLLTYQVGRDFATIALTKKSHDESEFISMHHSFGYSDKPIYPPYTPLKITKEQADRFCKDLMGLFDE